MRLRNGTGAVALAARALRARLRWAVRLRHGPIVAVSTDPVTIPCSVVMKKVDGSRNMSVLIFCVQRFGCSK